MKKYEVEFNKAALSLSETLHVQNQKKAALARLLKVLMFYCDAFDKASTS